MIISISKCDIRYLIIIIQNNDYNESINGNRKTLMFVVDVDRKEGAKY